MVKKTDTKKTKTRYIPVSVGGISFSETDRMNKEQDFYISHGLHPKWKHDEKNNKIIISVPEKELRKALELENSPRIMKNKPVVTRRLRITPKRPRIR